MTVDSGERAERPLRGEEEEEEEAMLPLQLRNPVSSFVIHILTLSYWFEDRNQTNLEDLNRMLQTLSNGGSSDIGSLASSSHFFARAVVTFNHCGGGTCIRKRLRRRIA